MDIKIIINALIVIFILHVIILNTDFNIIFGKPSSKIENFKEDDTMKFLTNNDTKNEDFKKKLLNYMQQDVSNDNETDFGKKNISDVAPGNTFLGDKNTPNFESNVADISKFYNISFDNLDETKLKKTSETIENTSKENCNINPYVRESKENPDNWTYKDELPMNGGGMNGIVGFDMLESQFANYNGNKLNVQSVSNNNFENIPHDDLRKPIVYEN
jgi:hypothetical protein